MLYPLYRLKQKRNNKRKQTQASKNKIPLEHDKNNIVNSDKQSNL